MNAYMIMIDWVLLPYDGGSLGFNDGEIGTKYFSGLKLEPLNLKRIFAATRKRSFVAQTLVWRRSVENGEKIWLEFSSTM